MNGQRQQSSEQTTESVIVKVPTFRFEALKRLANSRSPSCPNPKTVGEFIGKIVEAWLAHQPVSIYTNAGDASHALEILPTSNKPSHEQVGKKFKEVYEAMLRAYRSERDKEAGAKNALDICHKNVGVINEVAGTLEAILGLKKALEEGLTEIQEQRAKGEARAVSIHAGGCLVIKLVLCGRHCSGCPHGPYAYKVTRVGGRQVWKYLGKFLPTGNMESASQRVGKKSNNTEVSRVGITWDLNPRPRRQPAANRLNLQESACLASKTNKGVRRQIGLMSELQKTKLYSKDHCRMGLYLHNNTGRT